MARFPQTGLLVASLKRALKKRGLTYAQVAHALRLSEASVKRLFSEQSFSLQRLEQIAELAGLSLAELAHLADSDAGRQSQLSEQQERELVAQPALLLCFYLLLNGYRTADILSDYAIDQHQLIGLLVRLDRMGLIELLPENRVRLLTSRFLQWRQQGPIRAFFDQQVREEFFQARFDQPAEHMSFVSGMLSKSSLHLMEKKLAQLADEFNELARLDASLPLNERHGCSLMLAQRLWQFSLFSGLARGDEAPPNSTDADLDGAS